jgi:hypothetical protein
MRGRVSGCTSQGKGIAGTVIDPWDEIRISKFFACKLQARFCEFISEEKNLNCETFL